MPDGFNIQHEEDERKVCSDCGNEFLYTKRDKDFYEANNYVPPKRCPKCRAIRKADKAKHENKQ